MSEHFNQSAKDWDKKQLRIRNAQKNAATIKNRITFLPHQKIMDFGTGTGLLAWEIAPSVAYILGVDTSEEMLKVFAEKEWPCKTATANIELNKQLPENDFDGIISSMTLHHVENVPEYFKAFNNMLVKGGFIAITDLDEEDGSFHTSGNDGVYHLGFNRDTLKKQLENAGFERITFDLANVIEKEVENGGQKQFPIFLMVGWKK